MKTNERVIGQRPHFPFLSIMVAAALISTLIGLCNARAGTGLRDIRESRSPTDTVTSSEIEQQPDKERNLQDVLNTTPGIVTQSQEQGTGQISIRGIDSRKWQDYRQLSDFPGETPPSTDTVSYQGFKISLKDRLDKGLTFSPTYKGWNDPLHRDRLRITYNAFEDTPLTPETVSQPEYVTGLPATFFNYKPLGELSVASIGLDYRFTDTDYIKASGSYAQRSPAVRNMADRQVLRIVANGILMDQSFLSIGQTVYQNTNSSLTAAEAIALAYAADDLLMWGGEPPNERELQEIIDSALMTTWFFILNNHDTISGRNAALAMARAVFTLSGDIAQAHDVAMHTLDLFKDATQADREFINGVLGFVALGQYFAGRAPTQYRYDSLYNPEKGIEAIQFSDQYRLQPVFSYLELWRWFMGPIDPNDPLYMKKGGGGKAAAGLKKGLGFLLGAVGAPVSVDSNLADDQWGLHAVGFKPRGTPGSAWDIADGSQKNVVVAVIDSGLDTTHPDRPQYLWTNADEVPDNGVDDDANGYVDDVHGWNFVAESHDIRDNFGHGTFVSGIIAAKRNNGEGIAGINPGAQIMTLKVLNEKGSSKSIGVYRAIRYAVDNGARVLNLSLGGRGLSPLEQIGINYAYTMGCIVVVAAGNQSGDIAQFGPPGARRSFSVASMNMDSSRRDASNKGLNVALAAPGESVYSLTARFEGKRDQRVVPLLAKDYHRLDGTSFAAPFVAATASLIWAKHPHLDQRQVEDMILAGAKDIHEPGWDMPTGQGKLDAFAALNQDPDKVLVPRITEFFVNKIKRRVASVDIYGVMRGGLESYVVEVGRGSKPKKWERVYGPSSTEVEHDLICRIDGKYFAKGSKWKVRVTATGKSGQTLRHEVLVSKK